MGRLEARNLTWVASDMDLQVFIDGGFDGLDVCVDLTESDLDDLGVTDPEHRRKLAAAAKMIGNGSSAEDLVRFEYRHGYNTRCSTRLCRFFVPGPLRYLR